MSARAWIDAKKNKKKWVMLTAYDAPTAQMLDKAGVDILLVGDSVGMVLLGYPSTQDVTVSEMLHHCKAVRRGAKKAFIVADMPFESVNQGTSYALECARRFTREAQCNAVKIEWSPNCLEITRKCLAAKIPVMGHLGLTPQTAQKMGGFKVQASNPSDAVILAKRAVEWESIGIFSLVLECVPENVAAVVTKRLKIPVFGIGAGPACDGQVLVFHDIVGLFDKFQPKFVKRYASAGILMEKAVLRYVSDVRTGNFPKQKNSFHMTRENSRDFQALIKDIV